MALDPSNSTAVIEGVKVGMIGLLQVWLIRWLLVVIDNVSAGTIEKLSSLYALLFRQLEHTLLVNSSLMCYTSGSLT